MTVRIVGDHLTVDQVTEILTTLTTALAFADRITAGTILIDGGSDDV